MAEGGAHRMEPIAVLPVFFKLAGRRVVLAGGGEPAAWKAELLAAAGGHVAIFAPDPCDALRQLLADPPAAGGLTHHARAWEPADLDGAALAVGAIEDAAEAGRFRAAAAAAGVPVNVIDRPAFCDFQFGTVVSRSPLVIGISTDGAAPVFGQAIRARIEALLPQSLKRWAEAARDWRPAVQALGLDFRARRRFWEMFTDRALADASGAPGEGDLEACRAAIAAPPGPAEVVLVCAGPGDPDAVTLQAIRALQSADAVLHSPTVPPAVIGYARREAAKIVVDDDPLPPAATVLLVPGRKLAWLDSGDPQRCLRWQRRRDALLALGIRVSAVSGLGRCDACAPGCSTWGPG